MNLHPYFDLLLHSDEELSALLGSPLSGRMTLHEWPLSCVQHLSLEDGRRLVYKVECVPPFIEPQFYRAARSPLLVKIETLYQNEKQACFVQEYLDAPRLKDLRLSESEAVQVGQVLEKSITGITGNPPVYLNISGWANWQTQAAFIVSGLTTLIERGQMPDLSADALALVTTRAESDTIRAAIESPGVLLHGDLSADNVLVLTDGDFRVMDWQYPLIGPAGVDQVKLLESFGYDPARYVEPSIFWIATLLKIHWLVACSLTWFPPGIPAYDPMIARLIDSLK